MVWTLSNAPDKKELVGDLVEGRAEIEHPTSAPRLQYTVNFSSYYSTTRLG